jgi:hypothetical protein
MALSAGSIQHSANALKAGLTADGSWSRESKNSRIWMSTG